MNPIAVAIKAELADAEARQIELQDQLETQDQLVDHLNRVLTTFEDGPAATIEVVHVDPQVVPDAAQDAATEIARSVVEDPPKGGTKGQILEILKSGSKSQADLQREIGVSSPSMTYAVQALLKEAKIEQNGKEGRSKVWQLPTKAPASLSDAEVSEVEQFEQDTELEPVAPHTALPPARPATNAGTTSTASAGSVGQDTRTARNGEDIDDVVYEEIEDEGPLEYHEIVTATGESGVLIKAALGRLKAQNRIDEGDDGKFRIRLNQSPREAAEAAATEEPNKDLRKRIRAVLKAHNGASARKLSGLLRGVSDSEVSTELHRMQDEDLVNYYGLTRQWKLIED